MNNPKQQIGTMVDIWILLKNKLEYINSNDQFNMRREEFFLRMIKHKIWNMV